MFRCAGSAVLQRAFEPIAGRFGQASRRVAIASEHDSETESEREHNQLCANRDPSFRGQTTTIEMIDQGPT
jgi:hypothetical protein